MGTAKGRRPIPSKLWGNKYIKIICYQYVMYGYDRNFPVGKGDKMNKRPLSAIAAEISTDWQKPYFAAVPYLQAMGTLGSVGDSYGYDSGDSIVRYFLANAQTWRGDTARRVKAELKSMI